MRRIPIIAFIVVSTPLVCLGCSGIAPPLLAAPADTGADAGGNAGDQSIGSVVDDDAGGARPANAVDDDAGAAYTGAAVVDGGGGSSRSPVSPASAPGISNQVDPAPSSSSAPPQDESGQETGKGDGGGRRQHQRDDG